MGRPNRLGGVWVYANKTGFYCKWRQDGLMRSSKTFATRVEADQSAERIRRELGQASVTVSGAWDAYVEDRRAHGVRENSLHTIGNDARRLLSPAWNEPLKALTPRRAQQLYGALATGGTCAVSTHQRSLEVCGAFARFAVKKHWLKVDPFVDVEPLGKREDRRSESMRREEARTFRTRCIELAERGDNGALAALVCLMCSLRPGEVVQIEARDLDGGVLWVDGPVLKHKNSRRQIEIKDAELCRLLSTCAKGKLPDDRLFPHASNYPTRAAKRIGGKKLNARALRKTFASLSQRQAWSLDATAFALGHGADAAATTARAHYISPGSIESGAASRLARTLTGTSRDE